MVTEGLHEVVLGLIPRAEKPGVILNLGCEDFHQKNFDFPSNYEVYNCDIDPDKSGAPNFTLWDLNLSPYPYPDEFADVVLSVEVLEHLESPWLHLREIKRILKPGGVLILTTPNIMCERSRRLFMERGEFVWFERGNVFRDPPHTAHINPIPRWELEYICMRLGLEVERFAYHPPDSQINLVLVARKPG